MFLVFILHISACQQEIDYYANMYSADICCQGSDLITPHKDTPSSKQQGVGSDGDNFPRMER